METFEDFARRMSAGSEENPCGKVAAPPKATYKISCVCTGVPFDDSCMVLGKSDLGLGITGTTCLAIEKKKPNKTCLAIGKN